MKNLFSFLQTIGKSLMLPVAVLPVAGILLGIGSANFSIIPEFISTLMAQAGGAVFGNLPIIFALGVAIGFTKNDGVAAVAAVVGFVVLLTAMGVFSQLSGADTTTIFGIKTIETGVFGGIIAGGVAAWCFNKFYNIKLPDYLGFFAGKRFVPIATTFLAIIVGAALAFIWPPIQSAINQFGDYAVHGNPVLMGGVYGFTERLLIPFGIHHIWNVPFQVGMGTFVNADGVVFHGDIARFFAGDPDAGFLAGGYLFKMFGLPAAAIAIWHSAKPENKVKIGGIMISAALTSFLTGITEPIEFSFLFVAPLLYVIHAVFAGLAYVITNFLDIKMAMSFSNGFIDYALYYGIATKPFMLIVIGAGYAVLYYATFRFTISKFNLMTPGRESDTPKTETVKVEQDGFAEEVAKSFGGMENIENLDACITRLRVIVKDKDLVNVERLKELGAMDVLTVGQNFQAIFGSKSDAIKEKMLNL